MRRSPSDAVFAFVANGGGEEEVEEAPVATAVEAAAEDDGRVAELVAPAVLPLSLLLQTRLCTGVWGGRDRLF